MNIYGNSDNDDGRCGYDIILIDFNLDGVKDLLISCPTSGDFGDVMLGGSYKGKILVFLGGNISS